MDISKTNKYAETISGWFENLVNLDISKTFTFYLCKIARFENLVNLDISKTDQKRHERKNGKAPFENLVNFFYDDAIKIIIIK